jgi:hypothetical protein
MLALLPEFKLLVAKLAAHSHLSISQDLRVDVWIMRFLPNFICE